MSTLADLIKPGVVTDDDVQTVVAFAKQNNVA